MKKQIVTTLVALTLWGTAGAKAAPTDDTCNRCPVCPQEKPLLDYQVAASANYETFRTNVFYYINLGYQPIGGQTMQVMFDGTVYWSQAMGLR